MQTRPLLYGLIGFFIGGLLVAVAATTFEKPASINTDMVKSLENKTGDEYDQAFIDMMIAHHEDAVKMAQLSDKRAKHNEVKRLSGDIVAAQEKEINQMKQWRVDWGYKTPADDMQKAH